MNADERPVQRRRDAAVVLLVCLTACGGHAPPPPGTGGGSGPAEHVVSGNERLGWTQEAGSAQEVAAFRHWVYVDDVRETLDGTRCLHQQPSGAYSCFAPMPQMVPGRHVLELTTTLTRGSQVLESARSHPVVVIVGGGVGGWVGISASEPTAVRAPAAAGRFDYVSMAVGLNVPIAARQLPDGGLLIGERRGTVKIVAADDPQVRVALQADELSDVIGSDIVLHGIVLHPEFRRNAFVYLMYTEGPVTGEPVTRVARFRSVAGRLGERAILLDQLPARAVDPGGAIGFGSGGKLYVATDDGGMSAGGWDPDVLAGTVLRVNDDGSAARDTPTPSPAIFAGLHRPVALGWWKGGDRPWLVDEALPRPFSDQPPGHVVTVHAIAGVVSACIYPGTKFPWLKGKLVFAQGDSLRYLPHDGLAADDSALLLRPDVGRIASVGADEHGFLYLGTGNTGPHEDVGRDVLLRIGPHR